MISYQIHVPNKWNKTIVVSPNQYEGIISISYLLVIDSVGAHTLVEIQNVPEYSNE